MIAITKLYTNLTLHAANFIPTASVRAHILDTQSY